jgi:hypothetical protein
MKNRIIVWFMRRLSPSDRLVLTHEPFIRVLPLRLWLPWLGMQIAKRHVEGGD